MKIDLGIENPALRLRNEALLNPQFIAPSLEELKPNILKT